MDPNDTSCGCYSRIYKASSLKVIGEGIWQKGDAGGYYGLCV